jgi:hypothetical protein
MKIELIETGHKGVDCINLPHYMDQISDYQLLKKGSPPCRKVKYISRYLTKMSVQWTNKNTYNVLGTSKSKTAVKQ